MRLVADNRLVGTYLVAELNLWKLQPAEISMYPFLELKEDSESSASRRNPLALVKPTAQARQSKRRVSTMILS